MWWNGKEQNPFLIVQNASSAFHRKASTSSSCFCSSSSETFFGTRTISKMVDYEQDEKFFGSALSVKSNLHAPRVKWLFCDSYLAHQQYTACSSWDSPHPWYNKLSRILNIGFSVSAFSTNSSTLRDFFFSREAYNLTRSLHKNPVLAEKCKSYYLNCSGYVWMINS